MKFNELSTEDQNLLNTDFGDDLEKNAAAEVALAQEMYTMGYEKLAKDAADSIDEHMKEEKKEEEEEKEHKKEASALDEESEKTASELSAFVFKGWEEGLRKLGAERHNDESFYLNALAEEKLAAFAMKDVKSLFNKGKKHVSEAGGKVMSHAQRAGSAVKKFHQEGASQVASAVKGKSSGGKHLDWKKRLAAGGKGLAHFAPAGAAAGAAGYGAHHMLKKKDEKKKK